MLHYFMSRSFFFLLTPMHFFTVVETIEKFVSSLGKNTWKNINVSGLILNTLSNIVSKEIN